MSETDVSLTVEERQRVLQCLIIRANEFRYCLDMAQPGEDRARDARDAEAARQDVELVESGGPLTVAEVNRLRRSLERLPMCGWYDGLDKHGPNRDDEARAEVEPFLERLRFLCQRHREKEAAER